MSCKFLITGLLLVLLCGAGKAVAQNVTLNKKNAPLPEVLLEIFKQTNYYFYASTDLLKKSRGVDINVSNMPVRQALDICFQNQPLQYILNGQVILIGEKTILRGRGNAQVATLAKPEDSVIQELDQVQIIGYGKTTRRLNTGNVSSVGLKTIESQPVTNPLLALQGRVPGLLVLQTNGLPGSPVTVQIRGRNSLTASNNPLYIIDGMPFTSTSIQIIGGPNGDGSTNFGSPLNLVNPADIQSIEVLKDADATAIYGTRGANGVILINTKRASGGKLKVRAGIAGGLAKISRTVKTLNNPQYFQLRRAALANSGLEVNEMNAPDLVSWDTAKSTDWQEWYMGRDTKRSTATLGLNFGDERNAFLVNGTYHIETTVLPGRTYYKRGTLQVSYMHQSRDRRFKLESAVFFTKDWNRLTGASLGGLSLLVTTPPNYPVYDNTGAYYWYPGKTNYIADLTAYYKAKAYNLNANTILSYAIVPRLSFKTSIGLNRIAIDEFRASPSTATNPVPYISRSAVFGKQHITSFLTEPQLTYSTGIRDGKLDLLAGATFQKNITKGNFDIAGDFKSDDQLEQIDKGRVLYSDIADVQYRYLSAFARANYNWQNKYIINSVVRRDGSSRFGPGQRFGTFFSLGTAWIFTNENFLAGKPSFLSFGKLRASYGSTGNDGIGDYGFISNYTSGVPYGNQQTIIPSNPVNDDFHWEVNRKFEAALEAGLFKGRIFVAAAWYHNRSSDLLAYAPVPSTTGFDGYLSNIDASVVNKGWEFEIRSVNISRANFKWSSYVNLSIVKNFLQSFHGLEQSMYANQYIIGRSLDHIQALRYQGLNTQTGEPRIHDVSGDGRIAFQSSYNGQGGDLQYISPTSPTIMGGLENSFSFRRLELDFFLHYVRQFGNDLKFFNLGAGQLNNSWQALGNYWTGPGTRGSLPAPYAELNTGALYFANSDAAVSNSSFLRLKNVAISIDLTRKVFPNTRIESFKIFVQGQNLFTITSFDGYDPETSANRYLMIPTLRIVEMGVRIEI